VLAEGIEAHRRGRWHTSGLVSRRADLMRITTGTIWRDKDHTTPKML
jgi:hypothetical protein